MRRERSDQPRDQLHDQPHDQPRCGASRRQACGGQGQAPAPEDQPFAVFIPELFLPALRERMEASGAALDELVFEQGAIPVVASSAWQVKGASPGGDVSG
ncbi:DUF2996 domain-containing protein [Cyanobium sp. ATX-6F1]